MKLVGGNLPSGGPGSVKLMPEEEDDLWDAYNLITAGDQVEAVTVRRIVRVGRGSDRVTTTLEVAVESSEYDKDGSVLRVSGKNVTKNDHIKIGKFHTLELTVKRPFVLRKEDWHWSDVDAVKQACNPRASSDLAVVLMQEGLAHLFLVGRRMTSTMARIEAAIPRKHGTGAYESAMRDFLEQALQAFLKHVDFAVVQCAVIAGPGFTKDQFRDYMFAEAASRPGSLVENKARIVLAHATSGYSHSLKEVLGTPAVTSLIRDTAAAREVKALEEFYDMITNDSDQACYGPKHVELASERQAIQVLFLTDALFRSSDVATRHRYVKLVEAVKELGATVHILSAMNVSGDQLAQLTGVAAILRYPCRSWMTSRCDYSSTQFISSAYVNCPVF